MKRAIENLYRTSKAERTSYGIYFLGQSIFYMSFISFMAVFLTDIGVPALTVSFIALAVKLWDAVNDPVFGGIVDKAKFKNGKFIPWLRISLYGIPLTTILFFAIPADISLTVKVVWAVIAYVLWDTAYTMCDVPIFGIVTTMTDNPKERTSLMTIGRVIAMLAVLVVMYVIPTVRTAIGGWLPTILVLSIIGFITMCPFCYLGKERVEPSAKEDEVGLMEMLRYVFKNKYLLIFFAALLICHGTGLGMGMSMYLARDCFGAEQYAGLIGTVGMIPTVLVGFFMPYLTKKFDKFDLYFWGCIITVALSVVVYFAGYGNYTTFIVLTFIRGIPFGVVCMLMFMFTPDCVEYGIYKTGVSAAGISFSIQTFSAKLYGTIGTVLATLMLAAIGFVEGEGAIQAAGYSDKLWAVYNWVHIIGILLSLPILKCYKLRDRHVKIMAQCNNGEISHEEAEAALNGEI